MSREPRTVLETPKPAPPPAAPPDRNRPAWVLDPAALAANEIVGFGAISEQTHAFSMIRAALLGHAEALHQRVFAITSAQAGNGKTHVAVNLAATLSRIHPTVLLELDLRQPQVARRLGIDAETDIPGIDDFLSGEAAFADTGIAIEGYELTVHRVRRARVNAANLLASPMLAAMLREMRGDGSGPICIVDTPPALVNDDLALIARGIDGVLLVVEEARSRKRDIMDVVNALHPTPIVGSILNNSISRPPRPNDYGYQYLDTPRSGAAGTAALR